METMLAITEVEDYLLLNLYPVFNNDSISYDSNRNDADAWIHGTAYPAEELPNSEEIVWINEVAFLFPRKDDGLKNNMVLEDQHLAFELISVDEIFFLCAGDNGDYIEEVMILAEGGDPKVVHVGISDWLSVVPTLGASKGVHCTHVHRAGRDVNTPRSLWFQNSPIHSKFRVRGLEFGFNPFAHIFCITFRKQS